MSASIHRRAFVKLSTAAAAFLAGNLPPQAKAAPQIDRDATKHRKNFVAIQVKPYAWIDEGIDPVLDNLQQKGNVNTVWAYTYDYSEARMTRQGAIPLPDHGIEGSPQFVGGAFYDYDPKYFGNTILKDFRSSDYGKFNVIADVAPKAKARGMDFFCWDNNNAVPLMNRNIPNFTNVAEIDVYGRRTTSRCFNHPDYRAHLLGKIESCLSGYASPALFSPPALALLKNLPVASDPCGRITYSIPNPNNENQYIGRADWLQSAKHTIYGRYFIADYDNPWFYQGNLLTTTRSGLERSGLGAE